MKLLMKLQDFVSLVIVILKSMTIRVTLRSHDVRLRIVRPTPVVVRNLLTNHVLIVILIIMRRILISV